MNGLTAQMPLRLPSELHEELKSRANITGLSLNQYCLYLLCKNVNDKAQLYSERLHNVLSFVGQAHVFQKALSKNSKGKSIE